VGEQALKCSLGLNSVSLQSRRRAFKVKQLLALRYSKYSSTNYYDHYFLVMLFCVYNQIQMSKKYLVANKQLGY
jgi:hypothetical protein